MDDRAAATIPDAPSALRWGVVIFPGTNCEQETLHVLTNVLHQPSRTIWHTDTDLSDLDAIVLPGGFAHGDYLRAGAVARFSRVMESVRDFAEQGKPVLGICNGFQVLLEAGLLPGAMLRNESQRFACRWVHLRVENPDSPFLRGCPRGDVLRIPIAHGEGGYYADPCVLARMEAKGQVVLRYCDARGEITPEANPNGSVSNIAGVASERGNVMGLMPHPERASEALLGSEDGRKLFETAIRSACQRRGEAIRA